MYMIILTVMEIFIDDQENNGTSIDHQSDGNSDIQATELESVKYELDFSMEEQLLYTRHFDEGYDALMKNMCSG